MDKTFSNDNAKLVKLNVIQNKGAESSYSYDDEKDSNKEKITIEPLPLCPQNIKINQTKNGILITWAYPKLTPVKIESFQIYFREINNEKPHMTKFSKMISQPTLYHHILVKEAMISTHSGELISQWAHPKLLITRCGSFKIPMSQELPPSFMLLNKQKLRMEEMFNLALRLLATSLPKTTASRVFNGLN